MQKTCNGCGETKQMDEYYKDARGGRRSRCRACYQAYGAANKDRIAAKNRAYYAANVEQITAAKREYRQANRDVMAARDRAYQQANRDARAAYLREYRQDHPEAGWAGCYRERAKLYDFVPVVEDFNRADVIAAYGSSCVHCAGPFHEIDHWPTAVALGGHHKLSNVRPSCMPCNRAQNGTVRSARQTNRTTTEILAVVVKGLTEQGSPVG